MAPAVGAASILSTGVISPGRPTQAICLFIAGPTRETRTSVTVCPGTSQGHGASSPMPTTMLISLASCPAPTDPVTARPPTSPDARALACAEETGELGYRLTARAGMASGTHATPVRKRPLHVSAVFLVASAGVLATPRPATVSRFVVNDDV